MTTKHSPERVLRGQANTIATTLKDQAGPQYARMRARAGPTVRAGIVMDDKTIILEIPWTMIDSTTQEALAEYIYDQMRETRRGHVA